jgi:uncharacterized protein (UPF0332 family)
VNDGIQPLLAKVQDNIGAAKLLLGEGFIDVAISRAYYAMFYCAQAFLLEKGITGSSHKRVISAFGQYLVSTGEAPASLHRYLIETQRERHLADYLAKPSLTQEDAEEAIEQAEEMLEFTRSKLVPSA